MTWDFEEDPKQDGRRRGRLPHDLVMVERKTDDAPNQLGFGEPSAFMQTVGLHLDEAGGERVTGWIDIGPQHHQPTGIVHGGVYAAAVEEAASFGAALAVQQLGQQAVGVANTTNFLRPISQGRVLVEALSLHQGRTQQLWEVRITREGDGKLVAMGQVRLQNIPKS